MNHKYKCCVIENKFGKEQEAEFATLDDARDFARKHARIVQYKEETMIKEFYYYCTISCVKCEHFLECIHPQP